ncbi:MAG: ribulose-phosphate 3-epimerase [Gammaproteobacteria bacterium]|jgi:ribulose-phosphate 3-epimerase|nr:ribulose-phosphate 3-epimerase [Gammaproteobacteria bacterium]|tara:strand:- start:477 stop:1142 length:666 start_codon:yes stop_codon:yes gene_type:complete
MKNFIAPSILSADFAKLGKEVDDVILAGADIIHFDVMDNHYVPNLTIGPMVCKSLKSYGIKKPIDVHLMTTPVDDLIIQFCDAGASMVSFHPEATQHIDRSIELVKSRDCRAGIALNPASPLSLLDHILDKIDFILIMSVNPGFGGQKFISNSLEKIKKCKEMIDNSGCKVEIEVDGGIGIENIKSIKDAGANIFVAGSAIFNSDSYVDAIKKMKQEISAD